MKEFSHCKSLQKLPTFFKKLNLNKFESGGIITKMLEVFGL